MNPVIPNLHLGYFLGYLVTDARSYQDDYGVNGREIVRFSVTVTPI